MHIYLIGYRGSGKTTVGKLLASRLDMPCVDCDERIEADANMSIREIFASEGEQGFRDREEATIQQLAAEADCSPQVVSLGGGAVLRQTNRDTICESGYRVWLTASAATLAARIRSDATTADRRPPLSSLDGYAEIVALLEVRQPLYAAVAQKIVDTEAVTAESICDDIAAWLSSTALVK